MGLRPLRSIVKEDSVNWIERISMTLEAKDLVWLVVQACEIQSGRPAEADAQVDLNLLGCNIHLNFSPTSPALFRVNFVGLGSFLSKWDDTSE